MKLQRCFAICFAFTLVGCSTVTLRPEGTNAIKTEPAYSETAAFYFWGLTPEKSLDAQAACGGKRVVQMQAQDVFKDVVYTVITLGIYAPRSARVWCE